MKQGIIVFAHNNRKIDYARIAIVAGSLAKKNLGKPVSLITDQSTVDWLEQSGAYDRAKKLFDQIILTERPQDEQQRVLRDGINKDSVPFNNSNRPSIWELTPYDRTLLIDSDYFTLTDNLNEYWDVDDDLLICHDYNDIFGKERTGYHDVYLSDTGIKLLWATTVMFTKNSHTRVFFELVNYVRKNYKLFSDIYRFDNRLYRNDISFSIAYHILNGFEQAQNYKLPPVFSITDKDMLYSVDEYGFTVLAAINGNENYIPARIRNKDVHIMNKQSILRNIDKLLETS